MHDSRRRRSRVVESLCRTCGGTLRRVTLCGPHLQRLKAHGDPLAGGPYHVNRGKPYIGRGGYVYERDNGQKRPQHRLVMERHLGRPLWPDEHVHHLNGDRTDNRIENLELWSVAQPSGQRVEDKLAYARELMARYAPEEMAWYAAEDLDRPARSSPAQRRRVLARLRAITQG